ncbi:MAG TPA: UDP-2,3-diacylglucosamine diphosphatase [Gammaproteobacteria bacterium]|jgi:UDP-2,3-diacylglucosamine pyrophosphatase LpxH|nr:UDP-2,3-diacylglucosamine diphosphatase [Gammaproteobacteria bacterium]
MDSTSFRTVWVSDVHLGSRACRVGLLLDFLRSTRCDTLYLVGDIIDLKSLRRSFFWPESHTEVLRLIMRKSQEGTRVVYIPGNHDDDLRALAGTRFGNIDVRLRDIHVTASGRRLLVLHGDEFDAVMQCGAVALVMGSLAYAALLGLNRFVHWIHEITGRPYWSLAQHVKSKLAKAQHYIDTFQRASLHAAAEAGVEGVVCGHIHKAYVQERDGLTYCNDGDWVESCTAVVERHDGALELLAWRPATSVAALPAPVREAA